MQRLGGDALIDRIEGIVHRDTQDFGLGIDLTVGGIDLITDGGSLDFGGSEFARAKGQSLEPDLASPEDDYGWWKLEAGDYRIRYNEGIDLDDGEVAIVQPHPRLIRAGGRHPAFSLVGGAGDDESGAGLTTLLTVGRAGCRLKENCRISRLFVYGA